MQIVLLKKARALVFHLVEKEIIGTVFSKYGLVEQQIL
jgi:hypothetical protein